jgi:hypothetical protein
VTLALVCVCVCVRVRAVCGIGRQSQNERKLIPLYVMDSILKNVRQQNVYATLVEKVRATLSERGGLFCSCSELND